MVNNDQNVISLKHRVVRAVCRAAWEGEIGYEEREKIVHEALWGFCGSDCEFYECDPEHDTQESDPGGYRYEKSDKQYEAYCL